MKDYLNKKNSVLFTLISIIAFGYGCSPEPQPIDFGNDGCDWCKMIITDQQYGAEIVTTKGKIYKFDAVECLVNFTEKGNLLSEEEIHSALVIGWDTPKEFVPADEAHYMYAENLPSPMGAFLTAYTSEEEAKKAISKYQGELMDWEGAKEHVLTFKMKR